MSLPAPTICTIMYIATTTSVPDQGSRINPVYPYDRSIGGSEVSLFAGLSRVRKPQSLGNLAPSIGSQALMREPWALNERQAETLRDG
jgi:hypothetical protein